MEGIVMDKKLITGPIFYGGQIKCILGPISQDNLDMILDIIDDYLDLVDSVNELEATNPVE